MHMLNIQKCMFVLQLHCTLHSAAWESSVSGANSHAGTQLSSSQRPHDPQAQYSVIPTHQMLCSDWQCWKTRGISSTGLALHHALSGCAPQSHAHLAAPGKGLCWLQQCLWAHGQGWSCSQLGQKRGVRHSSPAAPSAPGWGHSAPRLSLPTHWSIESRPEQPPGADVPGLPSHLCLCNFLLTKIQ